MNSLFEQWTEHYPRPSGKTRAHLRLTKPELMPTSSALAHDFYYYSDEFSVLFEPISEKKDILLMVEGSHEDPTEGVRVPILSTWSHLYKVPWEWGTEEAFAFYDYRWWTIDNINELGLWQHDPSDANHAQHSNVIRSPYRDLSWCKCQSNSGWRITDWHGHDIRSEIIDYTLFAKEEPSPFYDLVQIFYSDAFPIVVDWLEERGDPLGMYIRELLAVKKTYHLRELMHKCEFIKHAKNDRSALLLLLAKAMVTNGSY